MAIEDAGALGVIFSKKYFRGDIDESLSVYNNIRLPRVTRVQSAAARAAYNINERIGMFSPYPNISFGVHGTDGFAFRFLREQEHRDLQGRG